MAFVVGTFIMLAGIAWSTEGALLFTKVPSSMVFWRKGSDATLEWKYKVDNKTAEFKYLMWKVFNKTAISFSILLYVDVNGSVHRGFSFPPAYDGRVEKKGQATLVVKNVQFEDSTKYVCFLDGKAPTPDAESTVNLIVTGPCTAAQIQSTEVGGSATITCNATNVPGQNFTWIKEGQEKKINSDEKYSVVSTTGSSQLIIKNISVADRGYYTCDGTTNIKQRCSATVYLQVNYAPKQDKVYCRRTSYTLTKGGNETICCPVSGYPPPFVTWKKNGVQLKEDNSVLEIYNLGDEDFGNYTCTATDFKTSVGPLDIIVAKKAGLSVGVMDATVDKPAKLQIRRLDEAKAYVVKVSGQDIQDDYLIGTQTSMEFHYHTLVMKAGLEYPEEIKVQVEVSAIDDQGYKLEETSIKELIIKRPSDTDY